MRLGLTAGTRRRLKKPSSVDAGLPQLPALVRQADGTLIDRRIVLQSDGTTRSGLAARVLRSASFSRRRTRSTSNADEQLMSNLFEIDFDTRSRVEDVAEAVKQTHKHYKAFAKVHQRQELSRTLDTEVGTAAVLVEAIASPTYYDVHERPALQTRPFQLSSAAALARSAKGRRLIRRERRRVDPDDAALHPLDSIVRTTPATPLNCGSLEASLAIYSSTLRGVGSATSMKHDARSSVPPAAVLAEAGRRAAAMRGAAAPHAEAIEAVARAAAAAAASASPIAAAVPVDTNTSAPGDADAGTTTPVATTAGGGGANADDVASILSTICAPAAASPTFEYSWEDQPYRRHVGKQLVLHEDAPVGTRVNAHHRLGHRVFAGRHAHRAAQAMLGDLLPSTGRFVEVDDVDDDIADADGNVHGPYGRPATSDGLHTVGEAPPSSRAAGPDDSHDAAAVDDLVAAALAGYSAVTPPSPADGAAASAPHDVTRDHREPSSAKAQQRPRPRGSRPSAIRRRSAARESAAISAAARGDDEPSDATAGRRTEPPRVPLAGAIPRGTQQVLPPCGPSGHGDGPGVVAFVAHVAGRAADVTPRGAAGTAAPPALPDPPVAVALAVAQAVERSGLPLCGAPRVLPGGGLVVAVEDAVVPGLLTSPLGAGVAVVRTSLRRRDLPPAALAVIQARPMQATGNDAPPGASCVHLPHMASHAAGWAVGAQDAVDDGLVVQPLDSPTAVDKRTRAAHSITIGGAYITPAEPTVARTRTRSSDAAAALDEAVGSTAILISRRDMGGYDTAARAVRDAACRGRTADVVALLRSARFAPLLRDANETRPGALWAVALAASGTPAAVGAASSWHGALPADVAAAGAYLSRSFDVVRELAPDALHDNDPLDTVGCLDTTSPVFPSPSALQTAPEAFVAMYRAAVVPDFAGVFVAPSRPDGVPDDDDVIWIATRTSARALGQRVLRGGVRSALTLVGADAAATLPSPHLAPLPTRRGALPDDDEVASASDDAARAILRERPPPALTAFLEAETLAREVAATSRCVTLHRTTAALEFLAGRAVEWESSLDMPTTSVSYEAVGPHGVPAWVHRSNAAAPALARRVRPLAASLRAADNIIAAREVVDAIGTNVFTRTAPTFALDGEERLAPISACASEATATRNVDALLSVAPPLSCAGAYAAALATSGPQAETAAKRSKAKGNKVKAPSPRYAPAVGVVTVAEGLADVAMSAIADSMFATLPSAGPALDLGRRGSFLVPLAMVGGSVTVGRPAAAV